VSLGQALEGGRLGVRRARVAAGAGQGVVAQRRRDAPLALMVCTLLAVLFAAGVWTHASTRWLGYAGDPQQTTWFLRWTPYAIAHGQNPLLTDHIAYPGGANLMWNTPVVLLGVVLAPITLALGPVVAYNVAMTLAFALSGFACYLALRRLVGPGMAAMAGALLYEFSPYTTAHALGQLDLTVAVMPPLVLLLLHEVLVRRRWSARRCGVLLGLLAAAQALVSEEMLASSALAAAVLVAALAVQHRSEVVERARNSLRTLAWAVGVFVPLMALPLIVQFGGPQALHGQVQPSGVFVSDLLGLVVPTQSQLLSPSGAVDFSQRFSGNPVEWSAYLGLPLLVCLAVVVVRRRRDLTVRAAVVCGAVYQLLSFGPSLHVGGHDTGVPLPWAAIEHIPLLGDMLPGRMTLYVDLCVAVVVAIALRTMVWRPRTVLAGAAVAVSILPALPLPTDSVSNPSFFTSGAAQQLPAKGSVLVAPFTTDFTASAPMVWQAEAGMAYRMPGGYAMIPGLGGVTHQGPTTTALSDVLQGIAAGRPAPTLTATVRAQLLEDMRRWEVRAVVVGPMAHGAQATALISELVGCAPQSTGGVDVWWHAGADGCR
jgi:hypothetical protein